MQKGKKFLWQYYPFYLLIILLSLAAISWYTTGAIRRLYLDRTAAEPPFTFTFHYFRVETEGLPWEDVRPANDYFSGPVIADLGLPRQLLVRFFRTDRFMLFSRDSVSYTDAQTALTTICFGSISDLQEHVTLLDGAFPMAASSSSDLRS